MGITDDTQDPNFERGMFPDASNLGDTVADWKPEFAEGNIDGVIFVGGDSPVTVAVEMGKALQILGDTIKRVTSVKGHGRPKRNDGHEQYVGTTKMASGDTALTNSDILALAMRMAYPTRPSMVWTRKICRARARLLPGKLAPLHKKLASLHKVATS